MKPVAKCLPGALALLLILPTAALAASTQPIADVESQGDTLVFFPHVQFASLVLTVTGPCDFQFRQVFTGGEPFFRLDGTTIDGVYRYNLMREESISPEIIEQLLDARKNNDPEVPRALCRQGALPGPPISQSEGFQVFEGRIVYDPAAVEEKAARVDGDTAGAGATAGGGGGSVVPTKDFVIIDDLIVDGSACIGFDCVNGESFGFDTIRLKENNLRIKFDDTSTAASFPRNDWQLTANDSANGGLSKFSIDDISGSRTPFTVEANARSHSLYVDDGGRIGSRTSTPSVEIHTIDGDTPTLRLQQDGSSGFAPQTWDVAGNETNFFVRDVTNGSTLPFRIRPGAPSSSIFIDVGGEVGIGTSSPETDLHVLRGGTAFTPNADTAVVIQNSPGSGEGVILTLIGDDNGNAQIAFGDDTAEFRGRLVYNSQNAASLPDTLRFYTAGTERMRLSSTGDLTLLTGNCSDNNGGGGGVDGCDRVFDPGYELPSIEEHAASMWESGHLPAVGPTPEEGPWPIGRKAAGMLNELEKAHIYIEQLHQTVQQQDEALRELRARLDALEKDGQ